MDERHASGGRVSRRTVVRTVAWTAPVVAVATAAPAQADSEVMAPDLAVTPLSVVRTGDAVALTYLVQNTGTAGTESPIIVTVSLPGFNATYTSVSSDFTAVGIGMDPPGTTNWVAGFTSAPLGAGEGRTFVLTLSAPVAAAPGGVAPEGFYWSTGTFSLLIAGGGGTRGTSAATGVAASRSTAAATDGVEPLIGEVRMLAAHAVPRGFLPCDGRLLPIAQNTALFSLLGTTYGGNGTQNFALPDLRGRVPLHAGPLISQGEQVGEESHALSLAEMPAHTHRVGAASVPGTTSEPSGAVLAGAPGLYGDPTALTTLRAGTVTAAGSGQPHPNMQPFLALGFYVAAQGIFPSRD